MKVKKHLIKTIAISTMLILSSGQGIYANNIQDNISSTTSSYQEPCTKQPPHFPMKGKNIITESVEELQKSGVLNDDDIKNIDAYHQKLREQRKEEMKKKRDSLIDDMVNQKVISAEKAEKLKATIDKNIEQKIKEMEPKN